MNTKELQDNALNTIVGGSTYMTELKDYLRQSPKGACFYVGFRKDTSTASTIGCISGSKYIAADANGFRELIILANNSGGKVTLYDANGNGKVFTDKQLAAMR